MRDPNQYNARVQDSEDMLQFDGEVRHETDLAWLFWIEDADEEVWFPKSQCELDLSTISCPRWLARAKGLV